MKDTTNIALNKIVGTGVHYKGEDLHIERFKDIAAGKICIFTHRRTLHFFEDEIQEEFLDQIEEVKNPDFRDRALVANNTKALAGYTPSAENVEMKAILMEMMSKVRANPVAIDQAAAVCKIADTMVKIQKVELDMINMIRDNQD